MKIKRKSKSARAAQPACSGNRGRDEFTNTTKRLLAGMVGYRCSRPGCPNPTIGPKKGTAGVVTLGKAAHITAAGKNGPRRNDALTSDERRHHSNGIWLCAKDADHVDIDDTYFTVKMLEDWKKDAGERAFRELERPVGRSSSSRTT